VTVSALHPFLTGVTSMGCLVAATFFLRFWYDTRDRLFFLFAVAFGMLSINRAMLGLLALTHERQWYLYVVRLAAFLLIAFAVVDKNRR
jgi:hypothetical protein